MTAPDLSYTGAYLDRLGDRRHTPDWLAARLADERARAVAVWRGQVVVVAERACGYRALGVSGARLRGIGFGPEDCAFLGLEDGVPVFAFDLSDHEPPALAALDPAAEALDLRRVGPALPRRDAQVLAYARALLHWHRQHRFCGRCGSPTASERAGHLRRCTHPDCAREHYPRTDPAVIMLVTAPGADGEVCLLARHARLPERMFTTLAGFVEPGESLEEAVAREVWEEVGIAVDDVRYQASQPWPFPGQLMLGFRARARPGAIVPDGEEIREARWFTPAEVLAAGDWGDESAAVQLPRHDSIARWLIRSWAEGR
ncbi:NAD(+) diphosphatase [Sediminicurvatus halobius]|uniref:NAD(+) diphosphatase n=1 Tax=Sediminicurvatus halobius TaxID=2182432 RepID=A0A2U2N1E8_9GAMM|nr:NAD(+) diphosphatase [Spiribacter halobius]PWG62887.1 NAD(+) diphosphatase [Spiribacter halobius]UEX77045.1 NAD(+) diphosphatase [Spiribacter halobius]